MNYTIEKLIEMALEDAKMAQEWLRKDDWQFYVQNDETKEIFSVDLTEEDEDAVLPVDEYYPQITPI